MGRKGKFKYLHKEAVIRVATHTCQAVGEEWGVVWLDTGWGTPRDLGVETGKNRVLNGI